MIHMKKSYSFHNPMKALAAFCFALLVSATVTGCSDSDDDNNTPSNQEQPQKDKTTNVYDDLLFFQNNIIELDSLGNIACRYVGEALYDDAPEHLYIGVDSYDEAEKMFRLWVAPDVTLGTEAPFTVQLTDTLGNAQGTITFTKSNESGHVAEVTASVGTKLKYFNQITFLLNNAWPHNAASPIHHVGDVITAALVGVDTDHLNDDDKVLKWVCIQEERNGQKPIFVAITKRSYDRGSFFYTNDMFVRLKTSSYCPTMERAQAISAILRSRWEMFCVLFDNAGHGSLRNNDGCWINNKHGWWVEYDDYMYYSSGVTYGANMMPGTGDRSIKRYFLFKIDWISDSDLSIMLTPSAGTNIPGHSEPYANLFDNATSSKWYTQAQYKQNDVWFVEFNALVPTVPVGYKLFTASDTQKYSHRNPTAWKLYGKIDTEDKWTLLDERDTDKNPADALPNDNEAEKTYTFKNEESYMYFRLEISRSRGNNDMQLSKFLFTYE